MMLHIPIQWQQSGSVRLLCSRLGEAAALHYVLMWTEWGLSAMEWRSLRQPFDTVEKYPWADEDITFLIEQFCKWSGDRGGLIVAALEAGVLAVEKRGDLAGLLLVDFWRHNEHLSPEYKTMQQRGAAARHRRHQIEELKPMAAQQARIMEAQERLWPDRQATQQERQQALALVMRMDRACGKPVRISSQYDDALLDAALSVVRGFTEDDVDAVERYLFGGRDDVAVVKEAPHIIAGFTKILEAAR